MAVDNYIAPHHERVAHEGFRHYVQLYSPNCVDAAKENIDSIADRTPSTWSVERLWVSDAHRVQTTSPSMALGGVARVGPDRNNPLNDVYTMILLPAGC